MKVMDVLKQVKSGAKIMVTVPASLGKDHKYNLTDGTEVSSKQMRQLRDFLTPCDMGLLPDSEPQSYVWAG